MNKLLKVVNVLLDVFFIFFTIYMLINFNEIDLTKKLIVLCILPLSMVPYLLDRIKVYRKNEVVTFIYYVFLLFSLVMGYVLDYYYKVWWFDLFSHFISGIFSSVVALILLQKINFKSKWFGFLFIILFTISVAAGWEYFEFFCDKFGGKDYQWVISTGVDDTMTDMLIATLGGILISLYYVKKSKDGNDVYEKK